MIVTYDMPRQYSGDVVCW